MNENLRVVHRATEMPGHRATGEPDRRDGALIVTGMSGAGKTTTLKSLEDLGYETIDHLPLYFLPRLLKPLDDEAAHLAAPLAIGVDVRTRGFDASGFVDIYDRLRQEVFSTRLLFLQCDDEELRRRYTATRHRHPLAYDRPLMEGISLERAMLARIRDQADVVIDTTGLPPAELKQILAAHFGSLRTGLTIHVLSFSFRSGLPHQADLVFDVRFLSNPFYNRDLKQLTGRDQAVADYIAGDPSCGSFFASLTCLLEPLLPRYDAEGKSYLTIGIGCTGGRHRSVFIAEKLAAWLHERHIRVILTHRDLERSTVEMMGPPQGGNEGIQQK
jgi:Predicted P-loop-containing kinase